MIALVRAWPLRARAAIGLLVLLSLALFARHALVELGKARAHSLSIRQMIAQPLPAGSRAIDPHHIALIDRIRAASVRTGVLVERLSLEAPPARNRPVETAILVASGSERAMLAFVGEIEGARPAIRFSQWRIAPARNSATAVRLEARALMAPMGSS